MKREKYINFLYSYRWFLLGLVTIFLWFYWFEWRPSSILKNCYEIAGEKAVQKYKKDNPEDTSGLRNIDVQNTYYTWCLHEKGLK